MVKLAIVERSRGGRDEYGYRKEGMNYVLDRLSDKFFTGVELQKWNLLARLFADEIP